jgi:hypothetical protein
MDLPKQKNFYDNRRQFQGKDNPTDAHPDPKATRAPMPRGQILFGLLFLAFVAALAWLRVKAETAPSPKQILAPAAPATPAPAAPAKH